MAPFSATGIESQRLLTNERPQNPRPVKDPALDRPIYARTGSRAVLFFLCVVLLAGAAAARTVTVAVVRDGPAPGQDLVARIQEELPRHVPAGTTVAWKEDPAFDAGWDADRVRDALNAALADPDVEIVLAAGALVTLEAAGGGVELTKPVVSAFVQRSNVFPLPYAEGETLPENLSFTVLPQRFRREVRTFQSLVPFRKLHVVVDAGRLAAFGTTETVADWLRSELGTELVTVPVATEGDPDALAGAEAVVLAATPRLSHDARRALIAELTRQKVPTWSIVGHGDVEDGALAALTPDTTDQVVRRVALNLSRLLRGAATTELPVVLTAESKLLLNARTARKVGYLPDPETRLFASYLHPEALAEPTEPLELATVFDLAESGNKTLRVDDAALESVRQDAKIARSVLLPQLRANLAHLESDAAIAIPPDGTRGVLSLQQLIYDDRALGNRRAAEHLVSGAEQDRETTRLDILAQAGRAFFLFAQAQALYRVEAENLRLTEDFLELARMREEVGYSGRAEIVRWEATLAQQRSALFLAVEQAEAARIALNQVLGIELDRRWETRDTDVDTESFGWLDGRLADMAEDSAKHAGLRESLVRRAKEQTPEATALREAIAAQEIRLGVAKRRFYVPSFLADVSYTADLGGGDSGFIESEDTTSISIVASYPLFEGGRRSHDVTKAEADRDTLERQLDLVLELVEGRARTALRRVESSFPRLKLSRQAAASAAENLRLVQDQYAEGLVNVTDLLSAQNQKFVADQLTTLALYEYRLSLVDLERAIAFFSTTRTDDERRELAEWIHSAATSE